jgi:WD40 repeat protein
MHVGGFISKLFPETAIQDLAVLQSRKSLYGALTYSPYLFRFLHGHAETIRTVVFDEKAHLLASIGRDSTIILWDVLNGKEIRRIAAVRPLTRGIGREIAFANMGTRLVAGYDDGSLRFWSVENGQQVGSALPACDEAKGVVAVTVSPDDDMMAVECVGSKITVWKLRGDTPIELEAFYVKATPGDVGWPSITFSPRGEYLAYCCQNHGVVVRNLMTKRTDTLPPGYEGVPMFYPDGKHLAVGRNSELALFSVPGFEHIKDSPAIHKGTPIFGLIYHNGMLISAGRDGSIEVLDDSTLEPLIQPLHGHFGPVDSVAAIVIGDQHLLASGGRDRKVILWDLTRIKPISAFGSVSSLALSPDGQTLVAGTSTGSIRKWNMNRLSEGTLLFQNDDNPVFGITVTNDGKNVLFGDTTGTVSLLSLDSSPQTRKLGRHPGVVNDIAISHANVAASASGDTIKLWDLESMKSVEPQWHENTQGIEALALYSDGKTLVSGGKDKQIKIWNVETGRVVDRFESIPFDDRITCLRISPDGKTIAAAGLNGEVLFLNLGSRTMIFRRGHRAPIRALTFSQDGTMLATGDADKAIVLWDVASGEILGQPILTHMKGIFGLAFSPDGNSLVSGGHDHTIRFLRVPVQTWRDRVCHIANPLSPCS